MIFMTDNKTGNCCCEFNGPQDHRFFANFAMIGRTTHLYMIKYMRSIGLDKKAFPPLLRAISENEGISQDQMSKAFHIDKGAVAKRVKSLEDLGYISRVPSPGDKRRYMIYLTEKGREIMPSLIAVEDQVEEIMTRGLDENEKETLLQLLDRVAGNVCGAVCKNSTKEDNKGEINETDTKRI